MYLKFRAKGLLSAVFALCLLVGCGGSTNSANSNQPPGSNPGSSNPGGSNPGNSNPEFTYVTLENPAFASSSVAGLRIDNSGAATAIDGSPFALSHNAFYLAKHGQFIFVGGQNLHGPYTITTLKEDPSSGKLSVVSSLEFSSPLFFGQMAIDPAGKTLYTVTVEQIWAFSIDANGKLAPLPGSPVRDSGPAGAIAVSPNGKFLYIQGDIGQKDVSVPTIHFYAIDPASGQPVVKQNQFNWVSAPADIGFVITPDSRFLIGAAALNQVCSYALDPATGSPGSAAPGFTAPTTSCIASGSGPSKVALDAAGRLVAVANFSSNNVSMYTFSNGAFTAVPGSPFSAGTGPLWASFSSDGRFLFVPNNKSGDVSVYSVNSSTGMLTPVPGSPVKTGLQPSESASD